MGQVLVDLGGRSYTISIQPGILATLAEHLKAVQPSSVGFIVDERVADLYNDALRQQIDQIGGPVHWFEVPEGERSKSVQEAERLWEQLAAAQIDRQTVLVGVGGGVVGDLAGFIAATLLRGLRFIQVPTTLLAQVDSSVGGKVGINLKQGKNLIGAFWQPWSVLIDVDFLKTLDERNYAAGLAEVVKYGVILDADFFAWLEQQADAILRRDPPVLATVIRRCCELKAQVVREDELETSGRRAILNYGHTFGHAIEGVFGYGHYLHGEAVAIGMTYAARLAAAVGRIDHQFVVRQTELLNRFQLPTELEDIRAGEMLEKMRLDKKNLSGRLRLVLPSELGTAELVTLDDETALIEVLNAT